MNLLMPEENGLVPKCLQHQQRSSPTERAGQGYHRTMMKPDYARIIPLITSKVSSKPKRVNFMKSDATTDFCTIGFTSAKDFADAMKEFGDVQEALEVCRDERLEILDRVVRERLVTMRKR